MIKRTINTTGPQETDQEENQGVEDSFPHSDELVAKGKLSISINEASEEEIIVVNKLKEINDLDERVDGIFLKNDFKRLNATVRRLNNVLRFFGISNITEITNFIVVSYVWISKTLKDMIKQNQNHGGNVELKTASKN